MYLKKFLTFNLFYAAFFTGLFLADSSPGWAAQVSNINNFVVEGDPAPGTSGDSFASIIGHTPLINASNEVIMTGNLAGVGAGIWAGSPLTLAALRTTDAPGTEGAQFQSFRHFAIADNGHVLFGARLNGPQVSTTNDVGFWVGPPGNLELLVRTGDPATNVDANVYFSSLDNAPLINRHGVSAWTATLEGDSVTSADSATIWMGQPDDIRLVARQGGQAPGFDAGVQYSSLGVVLLNHSNQVAFQAMTTELGMLGFRSGIWLGTPGNLDLLASTGSPVPGMAGAQFLSFQTPVIDDSGTVTFVASWFNLGTGANGTGVWQALPGQLQPFLKTGDIMPGTDLGLLSFSHIGVNDTGQFAMQGSVTNGAGGFFTGIWAGPLSDLKLVALEGDSVPGLPPEITIATLGTFGDIQDNGFLAFNATLTGPGITVNNDRSRWRGTPDGANMLFREGDTVEVEPGVIGTIKSFSGLTDSFHPGTSIINASGHLVVWLSFAEFGMDGVFLARQSNDGVLSLSRVAEGVQLSWQGEGFILEQADLVTGPWATFTNQMNPQILSLESLQRYFRLTQ